MLTVRSFRLNVYLIYTVEHIEVIYVYRTGIGFHGRKYISQRYTEHFHFVPVYIKIELRYLRLQRRRQTRQCLIFRSVIH